MIDNDVPEGSTLLLNPLMVTPESGKSFPVDVSFSDSVDVLKTKILEYQSAQGIGSVPTPMTLCRRKKKMIT